MEVASDQTNDEAAVDAALEDQSVMTSSESEMLSNDQVILCWLEKQPMPSLSLLETI